MPDSGVFTPGERDVLLALQRHGVPFMVVGLGAAVIQGANTSTQDLDLWFADVTDPRIGKAVQEAGGVWISGSFGMMPPRIGGERVGDRLDVVTHMHGLGSFEDELDHTVGIEVDGVPLRVLELERIIASKRAAGRKKDVAALPALEEALAAIQASEPRHDPDD
jgi:predicted nucleotidyltransferase